MAFNDPRRANSLLTQDFLFRDRGNRPISPNRALLARGDGGTFWADTTISTSQGFNAIQASSIYYNALNSSNLLRLEPGAGVQFYSTIVGGQPTLWIAGTGPETLTVNGSNSIDLLNLPNVGVFGHTLNFQEAGDMNIYISDNTVVFDINQLSTLSSITSLQEITEDLQSTSQGIINEVEDLANTVNTLLLSSAVSTFWSTLMYTKDLAEELSTFTYSTFNISNNTLNITYPSVYISSLTVDQINGPFRSTFSSIYWSSAFGIDTRTSNLTISTIRNFNNTALINFDNVNNRIGINLGTVPPRTTVDINGIVYGTAFVNASDRRLKTDLSPLIVEKIPDAYNFRWKTTGERDVGFMADEIMTIAPECVTIGGDGYKAVNYSKLVPYCFAVIKDLSARLTALETKDR